MGGADCEEPEAVSKPDTQAKRIEEVPKREEKPVVIAKKTLEKKETPPVEKPKESPAEVAEQGALEDREEVKTEEHLDKALASLESKAGGRKGTGQPGGTGGGGPPGGTAMPGIIRWKWKA